MDTNGVLFVCGTPIGNLDDITVRCLDTLRNVDFIAAEDTRQTIKLLSRYNIKTPLTSYYEHNKDEKGPKIVNELKNGKKAALVSDAGMPGISDPGQDLIRLCHIENIPVTVIPGPTAGITALVLSGINSRSFCFEGFLPKNKKQRKIIIDRIKKETRTVILYEAPHHLKKTLDEIFSVVGNREAAVVKELTKKHESIKRANLKDLIDFYSLNEPKGEFVIIISGISSDVLQDEGQKDSFNDSPDFSDLSVQKHFDYYLSRGIDNKNAMKQVAKDRGVSKREIYSALFINKS